MEYYFSKAVPNGGDTVTNSDMSTRTMYIRWFLLRFGLVAYDILAVNFAYILALLVRFYVNSEFNVWAVRYIPAFLKFSPFYTVCCLVVFYVFGLYKSLWKYAGLNDMNRIAVTSLITCGIHICGTLLFVMRMPITYYALGAAFQFVLIVISRFSYRIVLIEKSRFFKKRKPGTVNVLIVGEGEACRTVIKHFERDENSLANPVCVMDYTNCESGVTMAGIPVISRTDNLQHTVTQYNVERVILADTAMPLETYEEIRNLCKKINLEVQVFSEYFQSVPSKIPLKILMDYVDGPVEIITEDADSADRTLRPEQVDMSQRYIVSSICAKGDTLQIRLVRDLLQPNDTQADWVRLYREESGEDVSFF